MDTDAGTREQPAVTLRHVEGVPGLSSALTGGGDFCRIRYDSAFVYVEQVQTNLRGAVKQVQKTYKIPMERAGTIGVETVEERRHSKKSPITRGVAGGILFGGTGAMLGGLSGTGDKVKVKLRNMLCIRYADAAGGNRRMLFLIESGFPTAPYEHFAQQFMAAKTGVTCGDGAYIL